jgi:Arc/MetJ family transcription regulator
VRSGAIIGVKGKSMRASVTLDDDLLKTAHEYTGMTERGELLREPLKSIIAREAGRRLLALAGTAPNIKEVRRRRVDKP